MIDFSLEPVGENGDIISVSVTGDLDAANCDYLLQCVEGQIEDGYTKLILDCQHLEYISSMGLGMLIRVHSRMKNLGGDVKLARLHGTVAEILRLVKLDRIFHLYSSVEEAAAAFGETVPE